MLLEHSTSTSFSRSSAPSPLASFTRFGDSSRGTIRSWLMSSVGDIRGTVSGLLTIPIDSSFRNPNPSVTRPRPVHSNSSERICRGGLAMQRERSRTGLWRRKADQSSMGENKRLNLHLGLDRLSSDDMYHESPCLTPKCTLITWRQEAS